MFIQCRADTFKSHYLKAKSESSCGIQGPFAFVHWDTTPCDVAVDNMTSYICEVDRTIGMCAKK